MREASPPSRVRYNVWKAFAHRGPQGSRHPQRRKRLLPRSSDRVTTNYYGSRSERGTRVAALFYSLIESAKLCGVEPRAYLREATLRAVRNPAAATLARDLK